MKADFYRVFRSGLSLLLVCCIVVGLLPATAFATIRQNNNGDDAISYVALGASNTNGYGLNGYMPDGVHEDPLAAQKGALNVYGYKQAPESAYPAQVQNMLDLFNDGLIDDDVTLHQLAISSMRVEEVLYLLGDEYDYVNDAYMQWRFTGGQNWFAVAEPGGVPALREAYQEALGNADVISVDLGWNNFGVYAFNNIKTVLSGYDPDEDGNLDFWKEPDFDLVLTADEQVKYDEIKAKAMAMLSENVQSDELKNKLDMMADALAYATLGAIIHFDSIMEWIYDKNPDAKVVVVNIQNLADDLVVEFGGETLKLGDIYGELIDLVNLYRATKSPYADKYSFADAGDVETFLDEIVAWDGDPAKLTNDMKDCFDFYQDNPGFYVRSIVEYMMVGQAISGLFKGLRDTAASYGLSVFKDSAPNVADSEGYVYEFALTRTVEQLLSLNLGRLDLNNPAGADADVEWYGKALAQHLKNFRGEGNLDAYDYVFEGALAGLNGQKTAVENLKSGLEVQKAALEEQLAATTDLAVKASLETAIAQLETGIAEAEAGIAQLVEAITVIVPAAKAEFDNKLQGIYKSYHNTLNYTYDILATIVQYIAKINTVTMGEDMNLANTGDLATFITNSFMNGAQNKFYYELEVNGVQNTGVSEAPEFAMTDDMIAAAGLNNPATIAIAVFAVRYDLGNSFFAHPNEKGHDQITVAIFEALTVGSDAEDFSNAKIALYTEILKNRYPNLYAIVTGANQVGEMDDLAIIFAMLKLVNNPAISMMDLDGLEAKIRAAHRDFAASKTPEEQAQAQALVCELLERAYELVTFVTGTVYNANENSFYVSLGDSTVTGYGFDGYEDNQKNGWGQNVEGSAHLLLAQYFFGENWENQFANYCQGALRADDLLLFLGGDVVIDEYYEQEIEGDLPFGTLEATQENFINTVKKADLISVAIGGGNILTFVGKQMTRVINGQKALKLDWSKIGVNADDATMKELNEALDLLVPIVDEMGLLDQYIPAEMQPMQNPAKLARVLAESLLYGYASYNYYYPLVLERIKEINPNAQLLVLGMFNPVDDWTMTTEINGEETVINIGGATGNLIATANLQSLAFALQNENTTFVDISDAETHLEDDNPGKTLGFADYFGGALRLNGKGVHASEEGHQYIFNQMTNALRGGVEGALLDTYNYVMGLVGEVQAILNSNFAGVIVDLQSDLTVLRAELSSKINALNVQLEKLTDAERSILNEMLAERDALVEQLVDLKAQLEVLPNGRPVRNGGSATALMAQLRAQIAETEAAIAALDSSIAALNAKIAADLESITAIRASIAAIEAQVKGVLTAVAEMAPAVQKLNADLEALYDAALVLAAAINNVYNFTFDKIDVQAVINAVNTIYNLVPVVMEQAEDVYNKTTAVAEMAKLAATSLKAAKENIEASMDAIVNGAEALVGIEAVKLAAIKTAVTECETAVKAFVNDNYGDVATAIVNTHNDLKDLAYGEIAKAKNVLVENQTLIQAAVVGTVLALQEIGVIDVDGNNITLTPEYQKLVNNYIQMLSDKLVELTGRIDAAKQWLNENYVVASAELNSKLSALCEKLSNLEAQMREEYDPAKLANLKLECEQLQKLIDEAVKMQAKLDAYAQNVLDYIATVEAAIADAQTAMNAVIAAGGVVGSDIEALWNELMELTPALDALAKAVNALGNEIITELGEIFASCGVVADNFVNVLKTLPAYVDTLRQTVKLAINTWNEIVKTAKMTVNEVLSEMHAKLDALKKAVQDDARAVIAQIEGLLENLKALLAQADGLSKDVLNKIYAAIDQVEKALDALKDIIDGQFESIYDLLDVLVKVEADLLDAMNNLVKALKADAKGVYNQMVGQFNTVIGMVDDLNEILYNALHGEYTVTDGSYYAAITGNGNGYVDLLANELWLEGAQYGSMTWDSLDYVALMKANLITIGYDESTLNRFAIEQMLGSVSAYVDGELRDSANAYANGVIAALLAEIPFLKPEAFAGVASGVDTAIDGLLANELLADRQMEELDWAALVGEENLKYVERALDELEAKLIAEGVPEYYEFQIDVVDYLFENATAMGIDSVLSMLEPEALKVSLGDYAMYTVQIPVRATLMFAAESYLYGNLEFQKNYAETVLLLQTINPNATVILMGNYNAFRQTELTIGDVTVELGETYETIAQITSVHPFAYAILMSNVIYVDIPDVQTNYEYYVAAGYIENSISNFLGAYISDATTTQASPIGNEYIKDQILGALTVTCEHKCTDICTDTECARCGEAVEALGHSFTHYVSDANATCTEDGTKTAKCDRCDVTNTVVDEGSALNHDWTDWYVATPATPSTPGEERRDCQRAGCDCFETREIPQIEKWDPEFTVPTGLTATYGQTLADIALPEGFTWKTPNAAVGNAGTNTFVVVYTPADTDNYNVVEFTVVMTVEKANASVTNAPVATGNLIVNGTAQTLIQAGTASGGTVVYSLSQNGPFTTTLPTATEAGVYTIYYMVKGDANHNNTQVQSLTVTIYPNRITSDVHTVVESTYIRKIQAGMTVEQLLNNINEKAYVTIVDKNGNVADRNALVATGMVAKLIVNGQVVDSTAIIVTGDVNGDGKISVTDMAAVQHHVLGQTMITDIYLLAADTQNDGEVSITDFVQIQHHILEKSKIVAN